MASGLWRLYGSAHSTVKDEPPCIRSALLDVALRVGDGRDRADRAQPRTASGHGTAGHAAGTGDFGCAKNDPG